MIFINSSCRLPSLSYYSVLKKNVTRLHELEFNTSSAVIAGYTDDPRCSKFQSVRSSCSPTTSWENVFSWVTLLNLLQRTKMIKPSSKKVCTFTNYTWGVELEADSPGSAKCSCIPNSLKKILLWNCCDEDDDELEPLIQRHRLQHHPHHN